MSNFDLDKNGVMHSKLTGLLIAVDFDGTCVTHEYPLIGKKIGAVPVLQKLVKVGHHIILYTMRGNMDGDLGKAVAWFKEYDIPLFAVNTSPGQEQWTASPKPFAHIYIDDAALGCPLIVNPEYSKRPFVDWAQVERILIKEGVLYE